MPARDSHGPLRRSQAYHITHLPGARKHTRLYHAASVSIVIHTSKTGYKTGLSHEVTEHTDHMSHHVSAGCQGYTGSHAVPVVAPFRSSLAWVQRCQWLSIPLNLASCASTLCAACTPTSDASTPSLPRVLGGPRFLAACAVKLACLSCIRNDACTAMVSSSCKLSR